MENIKSQLLQNLQDIHALSDPGREEEHISLTSTFFDEETQENYELIIELIANKTEKRETGNYHSDRGDWEGQGSYFVVSSVSVQSVYVFKNLEDEADFTITNQEAEDSIKI